MAEPKLLDPTKATLKQLDELKIENATEILDIVSKLCVQCQRKDSESVIARVGEGMEQLLIIGGELGYREALKEKSHAKPTGKLA